MGKFDLDRVIPGSMAWRYSQADGFTPPNALYGPSGADIVSIATAAPSVGDLYAFPFESGYGGTIDQIGFNVATLAAGFLARCGLYESDQGVKDASDKMLIPGNLVVDGGEQDCSTSGAKMSTLSPVIRLRPRELYWLAFICTAIGAGQVTGFTSGWHMFGRNANFNAQQGWQKVGAGYGALPAVFPAGPPQPGICTSNATLVCVRWATYDRYKRSGS